ncbi:MAG: hypothetical protein E5V63_30030 [Mesorhizobium sp.]|nr:MAG: hypothetical protein E5V63_30030 [Mesorhizobium sp.]
MTTPSNQRKAELLGMSHGKAYGRLVKDIIFDFVLKAGIRCYRCGEPMSRETFSIEHKDEWQRSDDPLRSFLDLDNISYSHLTCNVRAKKVEKLGCGTRRSYDRGCRCVECRSALNAQRRKSYTPERRHAKYTKHGC